MNDKIDLNQALSAAKARRQTEAEAAEAARKQLVNDMVGDHLVDVQTVVNDDELVHDVKVARLQAATDGINGRTSAPSAALGLTADEQEVLDAFRAGRLFKKPSGAYGDKEFGKLEAAHRADKQSKEPSDKDAPKDEPADQQSKEPKKKDEPDEKPSGIMERFKAAGKAAVQNARD